MIACIAHDDSYDISDMYLKLDSQEPYYFWIDDHGIVDYVNGVYIVGWL